MRLLSIALMAVISFHSFANEMVKKQHCQPMAQSGKTLKPLFFQNGQDLYAIQKRANGFYYFSNHQKGIDLYALEDKIERVSDFFVYKNSLWILSPYLLSELNLETGMILNQYPTHIYPRERRNKARGFHRIGSRVFIASGNEGLNVFNLSTRSFEGSFALNTVQEKGRSYAVHVTGERLSEVFVLMTGATEHGFNGVTAFNFETEKIISAAEYDERRAGVIFPYGSIYMNKGKIYINNGGWIHQISKKTIFRGKKFKPTWLAIRETHETPRYMMIDGDFIFEENKVLGCSDVSVPNSHYGVLVSKEIK